MQLVSCHRGKLQILSSKSLGTKYANGFHTGLTAVDHLLPNGLFGYGTIHEILAKPEHPLPLSFATILLQAAILQAGKSPSPRHAAIVWSNPHATLYPPALATAGIPLRQLLLVRPQNPTEELWATSECLRCKGICAVLANPHTLSPIQARRLQLAAEEGKTVGFLLRKTGRESIHYAAATRWLVCPLPGRPTLQQWKLQLIHGYGKHLQNALILEVCRETNHVRAFAPLADRSPATIPSLLLA